jgi:ABC-type multidrug transport system fused ATPase/permease subunit
VLIDGHDIISLNLKSLR